MNVRGFRFAAEPTDAQKPSWELHPEEDMFAWRDNVFAVFDGVTLAHQHPYPNPSPAGEAARLGCEAVLAADIATAEPETVLRQMSRDISSAVQQLNARLGITSQTVDYLAKQYAATVGAFGFIQSSTLHCAQLTDCEVMVLDADGNVRFRLDHPKGPIGEYLMDVRRKTSMQAGSAAEHQYVRKNIINKTGLSYREKSIQVGVYTGEPQAEQFVRVGHCDLTPGDTVLFYSDGMTPFVDNPDFQKYLATASQFDDFEQRHRAFSPERHERTIIIIKY